MIEPSNKMATGKCISGQVPVVYKIRDVLGLS